jgi:hypothetical protein
VNRRKFFDDDVNAVNTRINSELRYWSVPNWEGSVVGGGL